MLTLRLTQYADSQPNFFRIEVALEGDGARQTAAVHFQFKLTQQEQENIRWYLEDYLQYLSDPAPQIAARVERKMVEIGVELFKAIFQANDDARDLWATLRQNLNRTRVEILTDVANATAIPWELLRDPKTDTCLAWRSPAFVRSYSQPAQRPRLPQATGDAIRILLVICRPQGRGDVPFRSVASRLIKGLGTRTNGFQLDVLRPPTFEQLGRVLRQAKVQGKPYHVVHFDGHGIYQNSSQLALNTNPLMFVDYRPGMHGYLAFENGMTDENVEFISGSDLGQLLVETNVPVLVLNACRSAHAEPQDAPAQIDETSEQVADLHTQVRSFGSLAQEVMDAGVAGVVAMRYNVYVITAAQFVANLYASLVQGQTLGEAVTSGRKQLKDQPLREVAFKPVALQDWLVPVVYEAAPITLFPSSVHSNKLTITLHENDALPTTGMLDAQLPKTPDAGFFGRDETLLAIDRAFDHHAIVLLHAFAGSGKTSVAAEFGRWYALTGGLLKSGRQGYVLFMSFQRYLPLSRVLDKLGQVFERDLERSGIQWLALGDEQRRTVALQVLSQVPVLWIWDNVEPIAGFPDGESQRWSETEQQELSDFLRDSRNTKAKFLLTSRRDEQGWLKDLPVRVQVPPMPMQEQVQFAQALAEKHRFRLKDIGNWLPLLKYTQGNPLTIAVVVGQALRNGYRSKKQIENFITDLRSGEAELDDDESEGRTRSLSASLSYGFVNTFNKYELQQLANLHLFQGFVNVTTLCVMGELEEDYSLPSLKNLSIEKGINLLDRAADIGLLTKVSYYQYLVHPFLSWYFRRIFEQLYSNLDDVPTVAERAFAIAMAYLAGVNHENFGVGDINSIEVLQLEEANLLYAKSLAQSHQLWDVLIKIIQGLKLLYSYTGRRSDWKRIVEEITPFFVDIHTFKPINEDEEKWEIIISYHVRLAMESRQWSLAERLQELRVEWGRKRLAFQIGSSSLDSSKLQHHNLSAFASSLCDLGEIKREQGNTDCISIFQEAISIAERNNDRCVAAICAFNLGHTYKNILEFQDFEQAWKWYEMSLHLHEDSEFYGRSKCLSQLGLLAFEKFKFLREEGKTEEELLHQINLSLKLFQDAFNLTPPNAFESLATKHMQLGSIYCEVEYFEFALNHYRESLRCYEQINAFHKADAIRFNIAATLAKMERLDEAMLYAQNVLQRLESYGDVMNLTEQVKQLIQGIQNLKNND